MLKVDSVDWCKFSAAVYEIGANWILCSEQWDYRLDLLREA